MVLGKLQIQYSMYMAHCGSLLKLFSKCCLVFSSLLVYVFVYLSYWSLSLRRIGNIKVRIFNFSIFPGCHFTVECHVPPCKSALLSLFCKEYPSYYYVLNYDIEDALLIIRHGYDSSSSHKARHLFHLTFLYTLRA